MNNTTLSESDSINTNKRISYIDISRGLAILFVIIIHSLPNESIYRQILIYTSLPLFIMIGGMFFKEKDSFINYILKTIKSIIIPYVISIIITNIIKGIFMNNSIEIIPLIKMILLGLNNGGEHYPNIKTVDVLWFLPFFALLRCIFYIYKKISKDNKLTLLTLSLFTTFLGYYLRINTGSFFSYFFILNIDVLLVSFMWFYIGYVINNYKLTNIILDNPFLIILSLIIFILGQKFGLLELAARCYPPMCYITSTCRLYCYNIHFKSIFR